LEFHFTQIAIRDPGFPDLPSTRELKFPDRGSREFGPDSTEEPASTGLCGEIGTVASTGTGRESQISLKNSLFQGISWKAGFAGFTALPLERPDQRSGLFVK
jgi:hypothetical protein